MPKDNDIVLIDSDEEDERSSKRFKLDTPDLLQFGSPFRKNLHTPVDTELVLIKASAKLNNINLTVDIGEGEGINHPPGDLYHVEVDINHPTGGLEKMSNELTAEGIIHPEGVVEDSDGLDKDNSGTSSTSSDELTGHTSSRAPMEVSLRAPLGTNLRLESDDDDDDDDDDDEDGELETFAEDANFDSDESLSLDQVSILETPEFSAETILETRKYLKTHGNMKFLEKYLPTAASSEDIVKLIFQLGFAPKIADSLNLMDLIQTLNRAMIKVKSIRNRLEDVTTFNDALNQIANCNKILVITGAGISTSIGIPDFRSSQGFYSQVKHLGLNDPQEVFDLENFLIDPSIFYSIAHMIIPPEKIYSPLHAFIKLLQDKNKLLRNYTQNIDNLESYAGISPDKLIQCHGSFATATCVTCRYQVPGESIFDSIRKQQIAHCPKCAKAKQRLLKNEDNYVPESYGVFKPDITFFGESLPKSFHDQIGNDLEECDLLISIGTSLKVVPVADIVAKIPDHVPQLLINKDPINHYNFDVSLLGYCDDVASFIANRLGESWDIPHRDYNSIRGDHGDNLEMELIDERYREYNITNLKTEALTKQKLEEAEKLKQEQGQGQEQESDDANVSGPDSSLNDVNTNQTPPTTVNNNQEELLLNNTTNVETLTPINS